MMASDFTMSRFKFLEKLILIHGLWSYDRLARMILYFFYKNAVGLTHSVEKLKNMLFLTADGGFNCFAFLNRIGVCVPGLLVSIVLRLFRTSDDRPNVFDAVQSHFYRPATNRDWCL